MQLIGFLDSLEEAEQSDLVTLVADAAVPGRTCRRLGPGVVVWEGNPAATDEELAALVEAG